MADAREAPEVNHLYAAIAALECAHLSGDELEIKSLIGAAHDHLVKADLQHAEEIAAANNRAQAHLARAERAETEAAKRQCSTCAALLCEVDHG